MKLPDWKKWFVGPLSRALYRSKPVAESAKSATEAPTNAPSVPDIAREVLYSWWSSEEGGTTFKHVTHALAAISHCASEFMPEILQLSRAEPSATRALALKVMGNVGGLASTEQVLARLTESLHDQAWEVRRNAAEALGQIGSVAASPEALEGLTEFLSDDNVWESGAKALGRICMSIDATAVALHLISMFRSEDERLRYRAVEAMEHFRDTSVTQLVFPHLINWLKAPDPNLRARCAWAAAATPPVVAWLNESLRNSEEDVRLCAARALGRFLKGGVRWFLRKEGDLEVRNVAELSGEAI